MGIIVEGCTNPASYIQIMRSIIKLLPEVIGLLLILDIKVI